jgi:RimJ/RimL family protein N-acetyltransferase
MSDNEFSAVRTIKIAAQHLLAPPEQVFPLLCPKREYDWIEPWKCRLVHSESGYAEQDCIFVTDFPGEGEDVWVVSVYRPSEEIQFVRFNGRRVIRYCIVLTDNGDGTTTAEWRQVITLVFMEKVVPRLTIRLDRLELIAATKDMLDAEEDLKRLGQLLRADVPANWPTPLYDSDARQHFLRVVSENPDAVGWTAWFILLLDDTGKRTLIGAAGACGLPDGGGRIVIGYSLLDPFHGKGYATEALRGFLDWAKREHSLRTVVADTFPHLTPSIRVLEKNGFVRSGAGTDEASIRFELPVR